MTPGRRFPSASSQGIPVGKAVNNMHSFGIGRTALATFTLLWAIVAGDAVLAQAVRAQPRSGSIASGLETDAVFRAWQADRSVARCGVCHYSPGNQFAKRDTDFCRLTEVEQWLRSDKHSIARQRIEPIAPPEPEHAVETIRRQASADIQRAVQSAVRIPADNPVRMPQESIGPSNFLSFAICKRLGYDVQTAAGYDAFRKNCLTCHAGLGPETTSGSSSAAIAGPGITCNYCHQLGTDGRWVDQHGGFEAQAIWRTLPPSSKAELGMRDLVPARAQAELCYRCHIGDLQHNMFVTHAMFAAGHPPLLSVEFGALVEAMPRHWRTPSERYASLSADPRRDAYYSANFPALAARLDEPTTIEKYPWRTDALVAGALVARQQAVRLIAQAADPQSSRWGDYALYDCAACHHELRVPSVRQSVRRLGAPGRPRLHQWPEVIARSITTASAPDSALTELETRLLQAISERPFGQRLAVGRAAAEIDRALQQILDRLAGERLTEPFCRQLLTALIETPEQALLDYHSARQINWAVRCLDADLHQLGQPLAAEVRTAISQLGLSGESPPPTATTTTTAVERSQVTIDVPGGLGRAIYPDFLEQELPRQANYDASLFIQQLRNCKPAATETLKAQR